jgi:hypothetical protein
LYTLFPVAFLRACPRTVISSRRREILCLQAADFTTLRSVRNDKRGILEQAPRGSASATQRTSLVVFPEPALRRSKNCGRSAGIPFPRTIEKDWPPSDTLRYHFHSSVESPSRFCLARSGRQHFIRAAIRLIIW